jgi:WD40 repeat protein
MNLQTFANIILIVLTTLPISALDHEKSFLVQDSFSSIYCIAVHKNFILISNSNDVVQRDVDTGEIQRTFRAHQSFIMSFLVTGDSRLITSSYDDMVIVWNFDTGSILKRISIRASGAQVHSIAFKNEIVFAGSYDMKVRQIDLAAGRVVKTFGKRNCMFKD